MSLKWGGIVFLLLVMAIIGYLLVLNNCQKKEFIADLEKNISRENRTNIQKEKGLADDFQGQLWIDTNSEILSKEVFFNLPPRFYHRELINHFGRPIFVKNH